MNNLASTKAGQALKESTLNHDLRVWTALLTDTVVASCETLGLSAAAKGNKASFFPQPGQEFLGLDVVAVAATTNESQPVWSLPTAVFELENSPRDERVAYSLWKVMCIRSQLRVVFAYRRSWELCFQLVRYLTESVAESLYSPDMTGECILALGSRSEGEGFPWGYFKFFQLNKSLMRFEKF
jgi:hypothetical protein